jgi:hypothetical protein
MQNQMKNVKSNILFFSFLTLVDVFSVISHANIQYFDQMAFSFLASQNEACKITTSYTYSSQPR